MTNNQILKILVALPVYNEEAILEENVLKVFNFLKEKVRDDWQIIIADNNSADHTCEIGKKLALQYSKIKYLHIPQKGKGRAIRAAWQSEKADVYSFMDIDLSTDLESLPELIAAVGRENYDLAIGSRFLSASRVKRSFFRKLISYGYRLIIDFWLNSKIKDAPCGFKAANSKIVNDLLPKIKNNEWFFDSELVLLAEKQKYKIKELPVIWIEHKTVGRKSRINFIRVILNYLKEVERLRKYDQY
jgi:glycosyltransferase involved in cell wall biosynthesis